MMDILYTGLPKVTVDPPSQSVEVTHSVKFTNTVSGVGKDNFSYQWRHNGEDIKGKTKDTFNIDDVVENSSGIYECVVTNEYGDTNVSSGELSELITNKVSAKFRSIFRNNTGNYYSSK